MKELEGGAPARSEAPPRSRPLARRVHVLLAGLLTCGVVFQFYAAWLLLVGRPTIHAALGWILILLAVLASCVAGYAHGWRHRSFLAMLGCVALLMLQPVLALSLARTSVFLGALHPVNGLAVFSLLMAHWVPATALVRGGGEGHLPQPGGS